MQVSERLRLRLLREEFRLRKKQPQAWTVQKYRKYANIGIRKKKEKPEFIEEEKELEARLLKEEPIKIEKKARKRTAKSALKKIKKGAKKRLIKTRKAKQKKANLARAKKKAKTRIGVKRKKKG